MGAERKDGFLKYLIFKETKEIISNLKTCFDKDDELRIDENTNIIKCINQYLETVQQFRTSKTISHPNCMNGKEILRLIEIIL